MKKNCTTDHPDAFWFGDKYFVTLPYKDGSSYKPQKASGNFMSSSEQELCRNEIQQLLDRKLIEPCKITWACPAFYVNKHSEQKRG